MLREKSKIFNRVTLSKVLLRANPRKPFKSGGTSSVYKAEVLEKNFCKILAL